MKYFPKDLYQRCQSDDEDTVEAASAEWEQANQRYEEYLSAIAPRLPAHVKEFVNLLLHDAKVLSLAQAEGRLHLVLHKDIPPRDVVFLDYDLVGEPVVEAYHPAPRDWSAPTDFQFDEFRLAGDGGASIYEQSLVLGNGWVMHLRFKDVRLSVARPLAPAAVPAGVASPLGQLA